MDIGETTKKVILTTVTLGALGGAGTWAANQGLLPAERTNYDLETCVFDGPVNNGTDAVVQGEVMQASNYRITPEHGDTIVIAIPNITGDYSVNELAEMVDSPDPVGALREASQYLKGSPLEYCNEVP